MSKLKDFYVEEIGHDPQKIENSPWYLSELALHGAVEVDDFLIRRNHDFSHVQELAEILGNYQLRDTDTALTEPNFPYLPLWRAVRKSTDKDIRSMSELASEMRIFRTELEEIPANPTRLEALRSLLRDLSVEFSNEQCHNLPSRLVA
ncbi:hypothetical protein CMI37_27095 [Candidatus Pacearchaeota archaeon]|nr:hypothetical protein [Candidatus Pacearchaeota archaeon]|tara:strand:+ start:3939 stop:4382 length:444 start_codon:yes stop_codon:yes gene_type:complete